MKFNGLIKKTFSTSTAKHSKSEVPQGMYIKCSKCKKSIYKPELKAGLGICPACGHYYPLSPKARLSLVVDKGSFKETNGDLTSTNPLVFDGYEEKLAKYKQKTGQKDGVTTGKCKIDGEDAVIAIMDSGFMMGSMGSVVGEKITRAIELATREKLPIVIFAASGGARMQEGIFSLMQMAKTSAALARHAEAGLLYISVFTDPTTGGVTASFATLGDIILAEPGALIGFAGPRVIEQTIRQKLPEGFQSAEFLLEKGQIDAIVERKDLKKTLGKLIRLHKVEGVD